MSMWADTPGRLIPITGVFGKALLHQLKVLPNISNMHSYWA
jgi:hypothetical protein